MQETIIVLAVVLGIAVFAAVMTFKRLICICQPNEVLIFSGAKRQVGKKRVGYKIIIGGRKMRIPLFERVDRMDLTNMVIDVSAHNAYSKGGIPLSVQGVANIKVSSQEPMLNSAIERFLGVRRAGIMQIAKATLEGSLRGVLATMTPEEVNEDKLLFAERMVADAEGDMNNLGLVVDNLKVQNVQDEVKYLDSIGRKQNAEVRRRARIAEAIAKADAIIAAAENREKEAEAQIRAQIDVAKADAAKRLTDAKTMKAALVAEEQATVAAAVAQASAEVGVQTARIEQVTQQLDADIIQPALAACLAAEENAKANAAPIIEDGRASADSLTTLANSWKNAGDNAQDVFLLQKLDSVIKTLTSTVADTKVESLTMIDGGAPNLFNDDQLPMKALSSLEQIKQIFGVDVLEKIRGGNAPKGALPPTPGR